MKNVQIKQLQVGDCVEVQRDLNYSASGKPWKGSVGVITNVDNCYYYPNVTYMVDFGGEMCVIPAHDNNIKLTRRGLCTRGSDRFILDTNIGMAEQLCVTTFKCKGKYYLNLESIHDGESSGVLIAVDPNVIMELASRIELFAAYNNNR